MLMGGSESRTVRNSADTAFGVGEVESSWRKKVEVPDEGGLTRSKFNGMIAIDVPAQVWWQSICKVQANEPLWLLEDFRENTHSVSFVSRHPGDRARHDLLG